MIDDSAEADAIAGADGWDGLEPGDPPFGLLLSGIAESGEAAPSVSRLAEGFHCGEAYVGWLYSAAEAEGLVDPWPGDEPAVTLSPLGAERLGVRLNGAGTRWVPIATPAGALRRSNGSRTKTVAESELAPDAHDWDGPPPILDRLADPTAHEAHLVHDATELAERLVGGVDGPLAEGWPDAPASWRRPIKGRVAEGLSELRVPLPTVLLGQRLIWPVAPGPVCRGCGSEPRPHEYCLVCDRYGRGWMLPHVSRAEAPKAYTGDGLEGGRGRKRARVKAQGCR